jgi:phosphotransferase system HPr (HPr) family protein
MEGMARHEKDVTVINKFGLHVRAVGRFVDTAQKFNAAIRVRNGEKEADGKSIIEMLTLGATPGAVLTLIAEGRDAAQAIQSLEALVRAHFHEE